MRASKRLYAPANFPVLDAVVSKHVAAQRFSTFHSSTFFNALQRSILQRSSTLFNVPFFNALQRSILQRSSTLFNVPFFNALQRSILQRSSTLFNVPFFSVLQRSSTFHSSTFFNALQRSIRLSPFPLSRSVVPINLTSFPFVALVKTARRSL